MSYKILIINPGSTSTKIGSCYDRLLSWVLVNKVSATG